MDQVVRRAAWSGGVRMFLVLGVLASAWLRADCVRAQDGETPATRPVTAQYSEREASPAYEPTGHPTRWYGWQTLLVDALPVGLGVSGILTNTPGLFLAGMGLLPFGVPIVHWVNGNVAGGFISLAMRVACAALTITGGLISLSKSGINIFGNEPHETNVGDYIAITGAALFIPAIIVDSWFVASVRVKDSAESRVHPANIRPWIDIAHSRAGLAFALTL